MATQTTKTISYGDRVGNSFESIGTGILMFLAGTILIFWNEGLTIKMTKNLDETEKLTIQVDNVSSIDPELRGKVIHATGIATTEDVLTDAKFGINDLAIRLTRRVEYYQVVETQKTETKDKIDGGQEQITTYTYSDQLVSSPLNLSGYEELAQRGKNFVLASVEDAEVIAPTVTFETYVLPDFFKGSISTETRVTFDYTVEKIQGIAKQYRLTYNSAAITETPATQDSTAINQPVNQGGKYVIFT